MFRILLCQIVNLLDNNSRIVGINSTAKSSSASIHNINLALQVLRNNLKFPMENLYNSEDIHKGDSSLIKSLLLQIKKVYKSQSQYIEKINK